MERSHVVARASDRHVPSLRQASPAALSDRGVLLLVRVTVDRETA